MNLNWEFDWKRFDGRSFIWYACLIDWKQISSNTSCLFWITRALSLFLCMKIFHMNALNVSQTILIFTVTKCTEWSEIKFNESQIHQKQFLIFNLLNRYNSWSISLLLILKGVIKTMCDRIFFFILIFNASGDKKKSNNTCNHFFLLLLRG